MCCLFGIYNYSNKPIKNLSDFTNILARESTARGTDATGISYCDNGNIVIHKEPKSAFDIKFKHPDSVVAIMGHTRHATQGKEIFNYNNHPFSGSCKNLNFALAHNGVLSNDHILKRKYHLPTTKIETDSYIAVQLIKYKNKLNTKTLRFMAEQVHGSFAFTVLGSDNVLHFVRGDSPLSLIHFPERKMYVYASTDSILYKSLVDTELFKDIKQGHFEEITIKPGDILSIHPDGTISSDRFNYDEYSYGDRFCWWNYGRDIFPGYDEPVNKSYIDDLKSIAKGFGYDEDSIDALLSDGFSPEEIEEYIYCME